MSRRTPRRRISPRTVRRYRAIKNFVRRALGSPFQPDNKSNSSVSVSVLDLRQKIDGIEEQLNTVSKHCQDLAALESRLKLKDNLESEIETDKVTRNKVPETEDFYRTSVDRCHNPINNRSTPKIIIPDDETKATSLKKMLDHNGSHNYKENTKNELYHSLDPIKENEQILRRRKIRIKSRTLAPDIPLYRVHSMNEPKTRPHYPNDGCSEIYGQKSRRKKCVDANDGSTKFKNPFEQQCKDHKNHKNKYVRPKLDQDFITDIIRRQYKPVKLFGRRESDFSQFSAPVCRDQEFPTIETVQEGSDLCSCCHENHNRNRCSRYMCCNDLSEMRSICDTRLYSFSKHKRHTGVNRKRVNDLYSDSAVYDVIPVKEKSSPKSRRKFMEENLLMHNYYREVPPSPRTQRPRLNLQAQVHSEDDETEIPIEKQFRHTKRLQQNSLIQNGRNGSNMSSEVFIHNRHLKGMQTLQISNNSRPFNEECVGTMNNLQYPTLPHEPGAVNIDTTLNTQTTDLSADKTDKTLNEIKDILQSFLQQIKKESSQSEKLNNSPQSDALPNLNEPCNQNKSNNFNNNYGHCGVPPFMQSYPNSCCYPLLPVCPINCMQNGFVLPSPSFTCAACANNPKERTCESNEYNNKTNNSGEEASSETQKLIKEIHHLLSQNPNTTKKKVFNDNSNVTSPNKKEETKTISHRSADGSFKASKHDAKVGTTKLKCHSKSCEAIGSREATDTRYVTNISYSDTVLEKGSGEEVTTEISSESEYSSESVAADKKKGNKFTKILRSIGVLKKNKSEVIEELSESEGSVEVAKPRQRSTSRPHPSSPFQQHIINYNVHGQEYFHPPVAPHHQQHFRHSSHYDPRTLYAPPNVVSNKGKNCHGTHFQKYDGLAHCTSPNCMAMPTCTNCYDPHYGSMPPQVPVCLKEIEVKSIGTQSVRKISLLQKLTNKMQVPVQLAPSPDPSSSRTFSRDKRPKEKPQPTLFDWKKIHEKAMPLKFSYQTHKKLAEGDNTMRNAMLKKLFYKRNPFSPRNLLVRTLLGKDRSSFGEPPKMYKPRMFL